VWVEDLDGHSPIAVGERVRWDLRAPTPLDRDFVARVLGTAAADDITDTYGSMGEYRPGRVVTAVVRSITAVTWDWPHLGRDTPETLSPPRPLSVTTSEETGARPEDPVNAYVVQLDIT
jgi:hypothetical protein